MAGANQLHHEKPRLWLRKDATAMEHAHQRTIGAELEGHIDVLFILKTVNEPNDVGMV
jgi:hypothetical protein